MKRLGKHHGSKTQFKLRQVNIENSQDADILQFEIDDKEKEMIAVSAQIIKDHS